MADTEVVGGPLEPYPLVDPIEAIVFPDKACRHIVIRKVRIKKFPSRNQALPQKYRQEQKKQPSLDSRSKFAAARDSRRLRGVYLRCFHCLNLTGDALRALSPCAPLLRPSQPRAEILKI